MSILVLQSFGAENEYRRAIFAIWSFWVYCRKGEVLLFTDNRAFFEPFFDEQPVRYILLTPGKISEMRGSIDFLHRMKIACIEEAFELSAANVLYVDSDTFFIADPATSMQQLSDSCSFMHLPEYRFRELRSMKMPAAKPFHAFLDLINKNIFYGANGADIPVSLDHYSWNAGVMMLHGSVKSLLKNVYLLTDQFYPRTRNHASEQYAFSVVLQNNLTLRRCDDIVYHYWYRVKKQIVDLMLERLLSAEWASLSVEEKIRDVSARTASLPLQIENHILLKRDNAIQSFNEGKYLAGYRHSIRAFISDPFNKEFFWDVMYHTRRLIIGRAN